MYRVIARVNRPSDTGMLAVFGARSAGAIVRSASVTASVVAALVVLWPTNVAHAQDSLPSCGGWPFGINTVLELDEERDLLFAGAGGAVVIQDVSDSSAPVVLSDVIRTQGLVSDLFYDEGRLPILVLDAAGPRRASNRPRMVGDGPVRCGLPWEKAWG